MLFLIVALVVSGCEIAPEPTSVSRDPTPVVPTAEPIDETAVSEWIAFRREYGLRADRDWVLSVARNPVSTNDTGIPLLPAELAALGKLNQQQADLVPAIREYGETRRSVYAGTIVDGKDVVLLVTGPTDEHTAALEALLHGNNGWGVRSVRWSLAELASFVRLVQAERAWFEEQGFVVPTPGPDMARNLVLVDYFASREDAGRALADRLGNPDWLELRYNGPVPWDGPRGRLVVRVLDEADKPLEGLHCEAFPLDPRVNADTGDSFMTNADGVCQQRGLPATAYRIVANRLDAGEPQPIGEVRVTVAPDSVTRATIVVH